MPRVRFSELTREGGDDLELRVPKPSSAAPGYTPIMLMTEWLTLNLRGDWAMRVDTRIVALQFADADDLERVRTRWGDVAAT